MPLPGLFVRFIGVCEVLGALGMILPGILRIRPGLTPLGAAGLLIIMIGATVLTLVWVGAAHAELVERGEEVSEVQRFPWVSFVFFSDPDGDGEEVHQLPARPRGSYPSTDTSVNGGRPSTGELSWSALGAAVLGLLSGSYAHVSEYKNSRELRATGERR